MINHYTPPSGQNTCYGKLGKMFDPQGLATFFLVSGVRPLVQIDRQSPNRSTDLITTLVVVTKQTISVHRHVKILVRVVCKFWVQ